MPLLKNNAFTASIIKPHAGSHKSMWPYDHQNNDQNVLEAEKSYAKASEVVYSWESTGDGAGAFPHTDGVCIGPGLPR